MARKLVEGVADIHGGVSDMADLARGMLQDGVGAFMDLDRERAAEVYGRREALADLDENIEHEILQFLTLQSPMAKDLRAAGAALKIITYLNRVGRYGSDIAHIVEHWPADQRHLDRLVSLQEMADKVLHMLDLMLQAYANNAMPATDKIEQMEADVDALRRSVWRVALTYMAEDPKHIEPCANYMMIARYLERCGDNICKMVEKQHYATTGKRLLLN